MKNKRNLKSLKLEKKTISNLNVNGGNIVISSQLPHTYQRNCPTDPRICDPAPSFPETCFPIDTWRACPAI